VNIERIELAESRRQVTELKDEPAESAETSEHKNTHGDVPDSLCGFIITHFFALSNPAFVQETIP